MKDTPLVYDEEFWKSMATSNDYDGRLYCKECLKLGVETDPIVGVLDLAEAADWGVIIYNEDGGAYWSLDEPSGWAKKGWIPPWSDAFFGPGDEEIVGWIKGGATSEGYCRRHWARQRRTAEHRAKYGRELWNKEAESSGDFMVTKEADWSEFQDTYAKAVILIDNSGSTAMEDTGVIDRETGHYLNRLDRHVLTAAIYLGAFPDSGDYRIITCYHVDPETGTGHQPYVKDFDNTDDAIEFLFTLIPMGNSFSFRNDMLGRMVDGYGNVLLIQDEDLAPLLRNEK